MEVKISSGYSSITGSLGSRFGYSIQQQKGRFYSKRNSRGYVPSDGHMRFIFTCAEIARMGLHFADVKVDYIELTNALKEAGKHIAAQQVYHNAIQKGKFFYNALDIINLKTTFGL